MAGFPGCSVPDDVEYQRASTTLRGRHRGRDSDWYPRQSAPQGGSERTINRFRAKREFVARGPQGLLSKCSRTSHLYDVAVTQPGEPPEHEHSLSSDLSDPLSTWSRCLALGLGGAAGVAGGFAVFASENQAGTAALLLIAGVLVLKAPIRPSPPMASYRHGPTALPSSGAPRLLLRDSSPRSGHYAGHWVPAPPTGPLSPSFSVCVDALGDDGFA